MKGIFLVPYNEQLIIPRENITNGIAKKILLQVDYFKTVFKEFDLIMAPYDKKNAVRKILDRTPFYSNSYNYDEIEIDASVNVVYMRRPGCLTNAFIKALKKIKKESNCRIIMEIPTYPYDREYLGRIIDIPLFLKDLYNRRKLKSVIDKIACLSDEEYIFGIKTIKISNGVDINDKRYFNVANKKSRAINLIMVANFAFWHGLDRMIAGLGQYYNNGDCSYPIMLDVVGTIPSALLADYKAMISRYGIGEHIRFLGPLDKEQLSKQYAKAHIGICSLGGHRKNITLSKELKSREYLAYLLPIMGSCVDVIKKYEVGFVQAVPEDDSPIDMGVIIDLHHRCYDVEGNNIYNKEIEDLVRSEFSIDKCMKNIELEIQKTT